MSRLGSYTMHDLASSDWPPPAAPPYIAKRCAPMRAGTAPPGLTEVAEETEELAAEAAVEEAVEAATEAAVEVAIDAVTEAATEAAMAAVTAAVAFASTLSQ